MKKRKNGFAFFVISLLAIIAVASGVALFRNSQIATATEKETTSQKETLGDLEVDYIKTPKDIYL